MKKSWRCFYRLSSEIVTTAAFYIALFVLFIAAMCVAAIVVTPEKERRRAQLGEGYPAGSQHNPRDRSQQAPNS